MTQSRTCPQCGSELPADAPGGHCPKCMLELGFESQVDPSASGTPQTPDPSQRTAAYQPRSLPPALADLAARFPQMEIGQGGMGVVYKARQKDLDRIVALKILRPDIESDPSFAKRFVREAQALAKLNHPAIVTVHDFGRIDGFYYFVMEYVDGANLRELERSGKLAPQQALALVPQICEALQYAHDQGVVHRDIKPENLLIDKQGRVKIADFGLAKMAGGVPDAAALTGAWQVMGTPHYMAPEQMQRAHQVDHRADIYSLGVVIYEMLTGELPVGRFPLPSHKMHVDVRLDEVVLRALEHAPERRYQHASEVKTDVETICGLSPTAAQRVYGHELRSQTTIFGLPLLHIAFGLDPRTGRPRTAKGIIAIGDRAVGVVAIGNFATGIVAIGGVALGLLSLGGLSVGVLAALGGMAVGGFAFGGGALGIIAIGGMAIGAYAFGGAAWGMHVLSSTVTDPEALRFFEPWAVNWMDWLTWIGIGMPVFGTLLFLLIWLAFYIQHRTGGSQATLWQRAVNRFPNVIRTVLAVGYLVCFWLFFSSRGAGGPGNTRLEYTIGGAAPWFEFQFEAAKSHHFALNFLSPTWLAALAAFGCLHLLLQARPKDAPVSFWERPRTHAAGWFLLILIGTTWGWIMVSLGLPEEAGAARIVGALFPPVLWVVAIVSVVVWLRRAGRTEAPAEPAK
jgi:tRNA A-37 threonylcarbamoyl transferase component Bud32